MIGLPEANSEDISRVMRAAIAKAHGYKSWTAMLREAPDKKHWRALSIDLEFAAGAVGEKFRVTKR